MCGSDRSGSAVCRPAWAAAVLGLLLALLVPAAGQEVVPGDGFAAGWKKSGPMRTFISEDLFNQIDGGAELFLEFGFERLFVQPYEDGGSELTAAVYRMKDATAALGIYLMKMGRETPFPEIASRNSSEEAQATILKGRYFVQIDNFGDEPAPRSAAVALANAVLLLVPDESPEPILSRLPAEGRVPGSERLIRGQVGLQPYYTFGEGDILRLNGQNYAALADYDPKGGYPCTRLIIAYPAEAAASAAMEGLRAGLDQYLKPIESRPGLLIFVDFQNKYGKAVLKGNIIEIGIRLASPD